MTVHTTREVADRFRCSTWKVLKVAKAAGIGMDIGGRAGWRFPDSDVEALRDAMRPAPQAPMRRRRRAS